MTRIFADTCYWYGLLSPEDGLHGRALAASKRVADAQLVTTDEVLGEFLNLVTSRANKLRLQATVVVSSLRMDAQVLVEEQTRASFDGGLELYRKRPDKAYSWVDCVSFQCMRRWAIHEALTDDIHFQQEGFSALLRDGK